MPSAPITFITNKLAAIVRPTTACALILALAFHAAVAHGAEKNYRVEFDTPTDIEPLLRQHLDIVQSLGNPRLNDSEWQRLIRTAPVAIANLLATEGYFAPDISHQTHKAERVSTVKFKVMPGTQSRISEVEIHFSGGILDQATDQKPAIKALKEQWQLTRGKPFTQAEWDQEKRRLLAELVVFRYPNAKIERSRAEVNVETNSVKLSLAVDTGPHRRFGEISISGLQRYPENIIHHLNQIKAGDDYSQNSLLKLQSELQATGYFANVEVVADTNVEPSSPIPVAINLTENAAAKVGIGVGASTNTGARTQLTYDELNVLGLGWRLSSSLRLEQRAQSLNAVVSLPTTEKGYRDSMNANVVREDIEGQALTTTNLGVKRTWGPRNFEQSVGANYLIEHLNLDGGESSRKQAATLSYGITLRHTDNDLMPTKGYLFNAQFTGAPLNTLSEGNFLRSYIKTQAYYPLGRNTQLMARIEAGAVTGANSAPATYLFRAGGDQSVRGYAYQSLGVREGDAVTGGRYLLTGSVELVQWLSPQWGVALFTDFGDAASDVKNLEPVYGYGLGARWKSPIGPVGADIAYGENTGEYRLHFNLGVNF